MVAVRMFPVSRRSLFRAVRALAVLGVVACGASSAGAQTPTGQTGTIQGTVSTQDGTVKLPGVLISVLRDVSNEEVTTLASDEAGHFSIPNLPAARYRVRGALDGFQLVEKPAVVASGGIATVDLDLPISSITENVEVVASPALSRSGSLATTATVNNTETQRLTPGEGFRSAVHLVPGVIEVSSGQSIDGGRPNQAAVQLGAATLADPATNLVRLTLPANAIDSVSVLPNPYEVEFGRFSSGLVLLETRRAQDRWKVHVDDLEPALRLKRFTLLQVTGIAGWKPTFELGGPLIKGRLFLEQTAQYRFQTTDIPSRPETQLRTAQWFSSLTRIDASVSPRHSLVLSVGAVPGTVDQATLGTFTPPGATADIADHHEFAMITERTVLNSAAMLDTTLQFHQYQTSVNGQGMAPMELLPGTTEGNFFNQQHRHTLAFQWVETASGFHKGPGGLHSYKIGVDVLGTGYDGTSASGPVLIERSDKTLARKLDFDGATVQSVHGTDIAVFAQDRFQPNKRLQPEFGIRVDHDAFSQNSGVAPRAGMALVLDESAQAVLRGGYGLFFERTPSIAGAFGQFESALDTRFARDGTTALGPPVPYTHVTAPVLQATRSAIWDLAYKNHLNRRVTLTLAILHRQDSHGLIVDPVQTAGGAALLLSSDGRAEYLPANSGRTRDAWHAVGPPRLLRAFVLTRRSE